MESTGGASGREMGGTKNQNAREKLGSGCGISTADIRNSGIVGKMSR
jgi:hypothetical protein